MRIARELERLKKIGKIKKINIYKMHAYVETAPKFVAGRVHRLRKSSALY